LTNYDITAHLTRSFIAPVTNQTAYVYAGTTSRSETGEQQGEFRQYAGGVTRLVVGAGKTKTLTITWRALTPDQVAALKAMVGKTCIFRDTYGRKVFGSFLVTSETDIPLSGTANSTLKTDVQISLTEVTYTEAV
jgi:hypothetical protein